MDLLTPPTADMVLSVILPTVEATADIFVDVPQANLTLSTTVPTLTAARFGAVGLGRRARRRYVLPNGMRVMATPDELDALLARIAAAERGEPVPARPVSAEARHEPQALDAPTSPAPAARLFAQPAAQPEIRLPEIVPGVLAPSDVSAAILAILQQQEDEALMLLLMES